MGKYGQNFNTNCKLYDRIYLTAIWLTPGGSSTHLHTNNTYNNTIDTKNT